MEKIYIVTTILYILGMLSFVVGAFLFNFIFGFIVAGVAMLLTCFVLSREYQNIPTKRK
ncbi:hypothetical protein ACDJ35_07055 [Enterococcus faecalis]|uniref:hypothetical protein n=1 Tax=Enterococcus TaxID=1350 RepID=UPI00045AB6A4|nr:hypothetical protein [Enterococcus faecalis]EHB4974702.1 hypothetical protein [Enterococcus faecalis]EHS2293260.1 hypothetical protein [Enterococcus faecalis]EJX8002946.1 hypothetical protein [Enterococcus faecalis]EKZ0149449.1 hypothetical protein [Enterococcus faecalis]EME3240441.1 hypothetical protein [Enterococcus faecalis]